MTVGRRLIGNFGVFELASPVSRPVTPGEVKLKFPPVGPPELERREGEEEGGGFRAGGEGEE